jgi:hypothetical protein
MKYKWITIEQREDELFDGKPVYRVFNNKSGDQLAVITWKCYVFSSREECVFNNSCLRDVLGFMDGLSRPQVKP